MAKCYTVQHIWCDGYREQDCSPVEVYSNRDKAYKEYMRIVGLIMLDWEELTNLEGIEIRRTNQYFEIYDNNNSQWDRAELYEKELIE